MRESNIIWHYTSMKNFLTILKQGTLRFSKADTINDSAELHWLKSIHKRSKEQRKKSTVNLPCIEEALRLLEHGEHQNTFLSCFSLQSDQLAQWNRYGDSGRGIAIGFHKNLLLSEIEEYYGDSNITIFCNEITYIAESISYEKMELQLEEIYHSIISQYHVKDYNPHIDYLSSFFIKNILFKKEREIRLAYLQNLFHPRAQNRNIEIEYDVTHTGKVIPYVDIIINDNGYRSNPITSLMLGPDNSNSVAEIRSLLQHYNLDILSTDIQNSQQNIV